MTARPRRSVLFVPGNNGRAQEKARALAADALIFDLEDSVAPDAKDAARDQIAASLEAGGYGPRELILRVNAAGTPWHDADLAFAARQPVAAVLLPKIGDADEVRVADAALTNPDIALWCMMETPLAFLRADAIASASSRLAALVMGTEDLGTDLHIRIRSDRAPLMTALQICVLAARAHGLDPLDSVSPDFRDIAAFTASCRQGRDLGFAGKTLIHPNQIAPANEAFGPSDAEIAEAQRIVAAFAAAEAAGRGIATLDGRMIERLHADAAQRLLAMAASLGAQTSVG